MKKQSSTLTNLLWDGLIFIGTLVSFSPALTGENLHEWIGLAFGAALLVHVLFHWQWIVEVTRRFIRCASWKARLCYITAAAIFIAFTLIIFSGVMESKAVLGTFGLQGPQSFFWKMLHSASTKVTIWLTGLHIALNWKWILCAVKKLFRPAPRQIAAAAPAPVMIDESSRR